MKNETIKYQTVSYPSYIDEATFVYNQGIDFSNWFKRKEDKKGAIKVKLPKKVIFNFPATIIMWENGDKTVVKASDDDYYDEIYGFLMAWFKYTSGLTNTQRDKYFEKLLEENYGE